MILVLYDKKSNDSMDIRHSHGISDRSHSQSLDFDSYKKIIK